MYIYVFIFLLSMVYCSYESVLYPLKKQLTSTLYGLNYLVHKHIHVLVPYKYFGITAKVME